jgi:methylated-DNA-[protein]-cysteine S-methyltransferase
MKLSRASVSTPLGEMLALSSDEGLCALEFIGPISGRSKRGSGRVVRLERRLAKWFPPHEIEERESNVIRRTRAWLRDYFDGKRADMELPLDLRGAAFEKKVWMELLRIRPGETTSYGAIAKTLGSPGASRAVGLANGANPIAIVVPCHRVIGSTGSLTGYGGGLERKTWLIDHERRWRSGALF